MHTLKLTCKIHTKKTIEKIFYDENQLLHIQIKEMPNKGKANSAVIKLFSTLLKIPQYQISILSGFTTTIKILAIVTNFTEECIKKIIEEKINNDKK